MRRRAPDLYERADAAIAAGKLWRAREILQGNIPLHGYDRHLFERHGQVLLRLGDAMEAGKYLFLSGERRPEYEEAISIFLARHGRRGSRQVIAEFPLVARLKHVSEYPEAVRRTLDELGVEDAPGRAASSPAHAPRPRRRVARRIFQVGCIVLAAVLFIWACVGIGISLDWIGKHWFGWR